VEDGESVAMIEKKFEALEQYNKQLQATTTPATESIFESKFSPEIIDPSFSEQQLEDMFKITSAFTLKDAFDDPKDPDISMDDIQAYLDEPQR
jgi:hypothetical protein